MSRRKPDKPDGEAELRKALTAEDMVLMLYVGMLSVKMVQVGLFRRKREAVGLQGMTRRSRLSPRSGMMTLRSGTSGAVANEGACGDACAGTLLRRDLTAHLNTHCSTGTRTTTKTAFPGA